MRLEPIARPDHALRVNSRLITSITILHFTSDELERAITQEQLENPAFEVIEQRICLFCGVPMQSQICTSCGYSGFSAQLTQAAFATSETTHDESISEQQWNEYLHNNIYDNGQIEDNEELDPLVSIPTGQTLIEVLLEQLETLVPAEDAPIAEQLVGNLNERGYLEISVEEIAEQLDVSIKRVAFVLRQLHTLDPPGIGARDLRDWAGQRRLTASRLFLARLAHSRVAARGVGGVCGHDFDPKRGNGQVLRRTASTGP